MSGNAMPKIALACFTLGMGVLCLFVTNGERPETWMGQIGRPGWVSPFYAKSARIVGHRLEIHGADFADPGRKVGDPRTRVLIYCELDKVAFLIGAKFNSDMRRATPMLGHEGPGVTAEDAAAKAQFAIDYLPRPIQVVLVFVSERGSVHQTWKAHIIGVRFLN